MARRLRAGPVGRVRALMLLAAAAFPFAAMAEAPCRPGPMPAPEAGAGWSAGNWPAGEAIRFSAQAAFQRRAYAVQISRDAPGEAARVELVRLARPYACNRWDREQAWIFPLGAGEADLFFEGVGAIEARGQPVDRGPKVEIVLDGTGFGYAHRRGGQIRRLRLSNAATGQSGRLSALILSLMGVARGEIPDNPRWEE
jgi:hypothetical protein